MTTGTLKTQGTKLYFAVSESEIYKVACPTAITGLGGPKDQIDKTCLDSEEREFEPGMANPAAIPLPINYIARSGSHQALQALYDSGATVAWLLVMSDSVGAAPTTIDSDGYLVSPGPSTLSFRGYVADFNSDFGLNEIVRANVSIQRSGPIRRDLPTADLA